MNNLILKNLSNPCPIFSIFVYFLLGSPTLTMVLKRSRISSSDIFFFRALSLLLRGSPATVCATTAAPPATGVVAHGGGGWLFRFLSNVPLVLTETKGPVPLGGVTTVGWGTDIFSEGGGGGISSSIGLVY